MSPSTSKTGDLSWALATLMDASGNGRLDQWFNTHHQSPSLSQIKKPIHGIFASFLSRSLWCVMREVQWRSMSATCGTAVSKNTHASLSSRALWRTAARICSSQCSKCTKCALCQARWSHRDTRDCRLSPTCMAALKTRRSSTIDRYHNFNHPSKKSTPI